MPRIRPEATSTHTGTSYPSPFDEPCRERVNQVLGDAVGLTRFGVNVTTLPPGAWSSQRHWHSDEDEFVWILEGEVVLVDDQGETVLRAGDCAGFPAGDRNGHHLQNRSAAQARVLVVGSRSPDDHGEYPGLDLTFRRGPDGGYFHRDGRPY